MLAYVERAVEHHHATHGLTRAQREAVRAEVRHHADGLGNESERHERRLKELQRQQQKLLHAHYDGHVDGDVLAAEQRIQHEREDARKWARASDQDGEEVVQALDEALRLLEIGPSL